MIQPEEHQGSFHLKRETKTGPDQDLSDVTRARDRDRRREDESLTVFCIEPFRYQKFSLVSSDSSQS